MRLDVLCLFVIGYFVHASNAAGKEKKDVQISIQIVDPTNKRSHQHTIYKSPQEHGIGEQRDSNNRHENIVVHNHEYTPENKYEDKQKYDYNPEKTKSKHKKAGKKKSKKQKKKKYGDDQDFKQILENYDAKPEKGDGFNDGYKTSVHTEHYEVKKINPNARSPDEKYIIEGAYKVQETDPWGFPTTSFHTYDSPISKIAASILSKYDYTNFRPEESDSYGKEKEEERDHDNIEFEGNDDSNEDNYDNNHNKKKSHSYTQPSKHNDGHGYSPNDNYSNQKKNQGYTHPTAHVSHSYRQPNGRDYEQAAGYGEFVNDKQARYSSPQNYRPAQPNHEDLHSKQVNTENQYQKHQSYSIPKTTKVDNNQHISPLKKGPLEIEYDHGTVARDIDYEIHKEFGHLVDHGHTASEPHYDYDSEWQKHLIDYIYGNDHAASTKYVQRVKPQYPIRA